MRVPEVRDALLGAARSLRMFGYERLPEEVASDLERWAEELKRKPRATNARPQSAPMTPVLRQRIREAAARYPGMSQHDIAKMVGTNQGRVSETLAGKRT
jgi:hypothetical protein